MTEPKVKAVAPDSVMIENVTFDELKIGRKASLTRALTQKDIELFAAMSGDVNPAHMDPDYAKSGMFHGIIGHGMWSGALISTVLGTLLPGPGTIYLEQDIKFKKPVRIGDKITVSVTVSAKRADKPIVTLDCLCINDKGETVAEGVATVLAPLEKIRMPRPDMPEVDIQTHDYYLEIIAAAQKLQPVLTAIVHPVHPDVLLAVVDAVKERLIIPVLIGPRGRIVKAALAAKVDLSEWELIDVEHSHAAAAKAVELAAAGKIDAIMKGSLHTDELLGAIVPSTSGLRTAHRISHAYVMDMPAYHKPLIITDAAVNIAPDLAIKADICQNAINLWHTLFNDNRKPKVAILAAVETVNPKMQATIDAAALCKMSERGQITGGIIDGPLAFDNAISPEAVRDKGIISDVAGDADILVVPEIESGNILAKQLTFLGKADAAGIILGARVPIILLSRSDNLRAHLMSCALAVKMAAARREGKIK
jgi:phosphate acetyltransferase